MVERMFKVGELAARTGLTVRTLHHWDEIGLLRPGRRTASRHRLYGPSEVARLQHIVALRGVGFDLETIGAMLDDPAWGLVESLDRQLDLLDRRIEQTRQLRERLVRARALADRGEPWDVDVFLDAIEETINMEKYYTAEQLAELAERAAALGPEGMERAQRDWEALFARLREHIDAGVAPEDAANDALLAEQQRLIEAFTGGNAEIAKSLQRVYEEEGPSRASRGMIDGEAATYLQAAAAARRVG